MHLRFALFYGRAHQLAAIIAQHGFLGFRTGRHLNYGYFARLEKQGIGINVASYVGATQVRRMVLGDGDRQPTAEELERMKALVRDAMREGAVGVSTALQYPPAPYAHTEELIALAQEAAALGAGEELTGGAKVDTDGRGASASGKEAEARLL